MLKNVFGLDFEVELWLRYQSSRLVKILNLIFFIGPDLKEVTLVKALKTWIRCALSNVYCLCLNVGTKVGFIVCYIY